jgi:sugar/nucleoside kinase (ribokinase family)
LRRIHSFHKRGMTVSIEAVGLGLCAWDRLLLFDRYPGANQKVEALGGAESGGGPVPTALAIFSKLGGKAAFLGVCGDDPEGRLVQDDLRAFAVDVTHLKVRSGSNTNRAYIWVDKRNGQRTVALNHGTAKPLIAA